MAGGFVGYTTRAQVADNDIQELSSVGNSNHGYASTLNPVARVGLPCLWTGGDGDRTERAGQLTSSVIDRCSMEVAISSIQSSSLGWQGPECHA